MEVNAGFSTVSTGRRYEGQTTINRSFSPESLLFSGMFLAGSKRCCGGLPLLADSHRTFSTADIDVCFAPGAGAGANITNKASLPSFILMCAIAAVGAAVTDAGVCCCRRCCRRFLSGGVLRSTSPTIRSGEQGGFG